MVAEERSAVVPRVGRVLRAVSSRESAGASTTEVAVDTGLARPTVHRLLGSLLAEGLVDRDERSGRWHLGPELYLLGNRAASRYDVSEPARLAVRRLAEASGESAFFSVRRGDEAVCLLREDGAFPLRSHVLHEGIRFPLGVASAGLAILAHLGERDRLDYLAAADLVPRWGEAHGAAGLADRIERTLEVGYATNPGLIVPGSWGMAAAVFDAAGEPRWALSLTGVESRFGEERRTELGRLLLTHAHRLGQRLVGRS